MRVVPEEAKRGAYKGTAENGEFANARNVLNFEISSPSRVAADISQHRERTSSDNRAADRQAVEAIRQIHGVRRTYDDHANKREKWKKRQGPKVRRIHQGMEDQIRVEAFEKGDHQLRRVGVVRHQNEQRNPHDQADQHLKINFLFCSEAKVALFRDFRVVIDETDNGEADQREERKQNKRIAE